jgi:hypothetical protein
MRRLVLVSVATVLLATGCKASERTDGWYIQSGVYRCASGQSFIGETADQTSTGNVTFGAAIEVRRDLFCVNEDNLHPGWASIGVGAQLFRRLPGGGVVQCGSNSPIVTTATDRSVFVGADRSCVAGTFYTRGAHYGLGAESVDFFTVTPDAYNA